MYDELTTSGTVEENLPADDRQVRELHRREVLEPRAARRHKERKQRRAQSPLPQGQIPKLASATPSDAPRAAPIPSTRESASAAITSVAVDPPVVTAVGERGRPASEQLASLNDRIASVQSVPSIPAIRRKKSDPADEPRAPRLYLAPTDDIEAAPSIGPKTAARFETVGIHTVAGLLDADPEETADALKTRHITAKTIVEWQHQARLVCTLPGIRGGHAQLLVGAGLTSVDAIAETDPGEAMAAILKFAQTSAGQSVLRDGQPPDLEKIHTWVQNAKNSRQAA